MSWDIPTESDCSLCLRTSLDSDFEYIDYRSHPEPTSTSGYEKKKRGLWTKVKKVFKRLIWPKTERKQCRVTQTTTQELYNSLVEAKDWQQKVADASCSGLPTKGG